ncbi:uncharacterized protein LOC143195060 [Rhynchophorus ferrugineus]|uniref:uncharacterized protein LOC143195060 n=1 Tax=Rhynchophorus ferrugineus TaxID=354439 RepID=UPI003FCCCDA2
MASKLPKSPLHCELLDGRSFENMPSLYVPHIWGKTSQLRRYIAKDDVEDGNYKRYLQTECSFAEIMLQYFYFTELCQSASCLDWNVTIGDQFLQKKDTTQHINILASLQGFF